MNCNNRTSIDSDSDEDDEDVPLKFLSHTKSNTEETERHVHVSNGYTDDLLKYRLLESDFCDDEEVPLKFLSHAKRVTEETEQHVQSSNGYTDDLLKYRPLECDFCDNKVFNRYQYFVHHASHIIIPLIKLNIQECPQCLHHFTSVDQLYRHQIEKNHVPIKNTINGSHLYKNDEKILESLVREKEPMVQLKDIKSDLDEKPIVVDLISDDGVSDGDGENETKMPNGYHNSRENLELLVKNVFNGQHDDIRNRLIFEEDLLTDDTHNGMKTLNIRTDLMNDCKVKLNVYDVPWWKNVIVKNANETSGQNVTAESVHYEDLMRPGFFKCRRCRKSFPNRYHLIKHETCHMKIRKRCPNVCVICEKIVGCRKKLKRHYKDAHPGQKPSKTILKCFECGLQYSNYKKHIETYHNVYKCPMCDEDFLTKNEKESHTSRHLENGNFACQYCDKEGTVQEINYHTRLAHKYVHCAHIYLCEVCIDFLKNRCNKYQCRYNIVGPYSEIGVRRHCDKCGKKCFELMIVDKQRRVDDKKRIRKHGKTKGLSNEDRLKQIKKRLKNLKQ